MRVAFNESYFFFDFFLSFLDDWLLGRFFLEKFEFCSIQRLLLDQSELFFFLGSFSLLDVIFQLFYLFLLLFHHHFLIVFFNLRNFFHKLEQKSISIIFRVFHWRYRRLFYFLDHMHVEIVVLFVALQKVLKKLWIFVNAKIENFNCFQMDLFWVENSFMLGKSQFSWVIIQKPFWIIHLFVFILIVDFRMRNKSIFGCDRKNTTSENHDEFYDEFFRKNRIS